MIELSNKNKKTSVAFILGFIVSVIVMSILSSYSATAAVSTTPIVAVQVGGGNLTNPLFGYKPQEVNIKVGETILWYVRPQAPAEPHTVTFVFDNTTRVNGFVPSNARTFSPTIIDSSGISKIYPANANLTLIGSERYVNSGWLFPAGPLPGSSNTFKVTFQHPGTYTYDCLLHPWMNGKVVVLNKL